MAVEIATGHYLKVATTWTTAIFILRGACRLPDHPE